jgi:hypothetical protein
MTVDADNPLLSYFESYKEGPGIWKWQHYFEIYHRYFQKFIGVPLHVLEIGVYSGGSLDMWKNYFGQQCHIHGVDIQNECKEYEDDQVQIKIGDQGDRRFWQAFKSQTPMLDIVIDDGSHRPEHQLTTFQEILPHIRPGGVYLCEDIHGPANMFALYLQNLSNNLNACQNFQNNPETPERRSTAVTTEFQSRIHSIHFYPYVAVIETNKDTRKELVSSKRGTAWQPFIK